MDRIKQVMRLVLICFMLVCCVPQTVMGMQTGEQEITEEDAERFLRDLLEAVKNKDIDKISNELWAGSRTPTDTIFSLWKENEIVSLKLTEKKLRRATAVKPEGMDFHYQIYTKEDEFEAKLSLVRLDGTIKSDDFKLTLLVKPTGTLRTWRTFNIFQWIMLFLAAAEIAFSVYTAWKCFKERPRFTALWIIFILVFYGGDFIFHSKLLCFDILYIHVCISQDTELRRPVYAGLFIDSRWGGCLLDKAWEGRR